MKTMIPIAMVLAVTLSAGCEDDKPSAHGAASSAASAAASPGVSAAAREGGRGEGRGEGEGEGQRRKAQGGDDRDEGSGEGKRGDDVCPPAVAGARTTIRDTDSGVILEVVADAVPEQKEIADRANALLERQAAASKDKAAHSGSGSGGGLGRCPVVIRGTKLTLERIEGAAAGAPGGTRIKVDAEKPEEVDALRRETKQRLAAMKEETD